MCILKAVHLAQFNLAPSQVFFNTGFGQPGRPYTSGDFRLTDVFGKVNKPALA